MPGMLAQMAKINTDPRITGVIMQRPVPAHLNVLDIQQAVHPLKDVEGMNPTSIGHVVYNEADLAPCTAKAAVKCLKATTLTSLRGLECVVVGASEIVGKPIAFLLMSEGAQVSICDHRTHDVAKHTKKADAVFVAVGKAGLLTGDMLKPGAVVVDVGINVDPQDDTKIVGDAAFEDCLEVAGWITPVPGGVGPVTTACLMENTVLAARKQLFHYNQVYGEDSEFLNILL